MSMGCEKMNPFKDKEFLEPWAGDVALGDDAILLQGKLEDRLPAFPEEFIHAVVTDGPYHLQSIVKRFGKKDSAEVPEHRGPFARSAKGFMGKTWDGGDVCYHPETWGLCRRVLFPGAYLLNFTGARTYHRITCAIEDADFIIKEHIPWIYGTGFPSGGSNISKAIDKLMGAKRGQRPAENRTSSHMTRYLGAHGNTRPWMFDENHTVDDNTPVTEEAKQWDGWNTILKPAHEDIAIGMKPLQEKTYARQVLATGTGAFNIEECSLPPWDDEAREENRYPTNVVISDLVAELLDGKARYFPSFLYCPKPLVKEKEQGLENFTPKSVNRTNPGGLENDPRWKPVKRKNTHNTVKPVELMRWLIRLVCPPGGIILDPFMGSGTTGVAAMLEGHRFIGIEMEEESFEIARARIEWARDERMFQ